MDISYRLNNSEIEKFLKYTNQSILLKKDNVKMINTSYI